MFNYCATYCAIVAPQNPEKQGKSAWQPALSGKCCVAFPGKTRTFGRIQNCRPTLSGGMDWWRIWEFRAWKKIHTPSHSIPPVNSLLNRKSLPIPTWKFPELIAVTDRKNALYEPDGIASIYTLISIISGTAWRAFLRRFNFICSVFSFSSDHRKGVWLVYVLSVFLCIFFIKKGIWYV